MSDPSVPLFNLLILRDKMDNLHRFLSRSVNHNASSITAHQQQIISSEIASVVHDIISNGAALLSSCQTLNINPNDPITNPIDLKVPAVVGNSETVGKVPDPKSNANFPGAPEEKYGEGSDMDIVELDAMELLAEHVHFCEICGKGFKRDANLRMHMRAHGNQYKTPEALVKPKNDPPESGSVAGKSRFSCPFSGCNRNKAHKKFRPLKSATCVKNHFKRSHCPKMFSCHKCNKKSFSVVADLKSHLKNCGECRWQCCCGTSFSRKDKLFGHMALFEGHMPAVTPPEQSKVAEGVDDASGFFEDFEATMEGVCFDSIAGDDLFEPGFSFPGLDPSDDSFLSCMRGTNNIR